MGAFTVIPQDAFEGMQLETGVLLKSFDPSDPVAPDDADIICATTGGITIECKPEFQDLAEDVDNVPDGMKEFMHLTKWNCSISTTSLDTSAAGIKMSLGCADIDENNTSKIIPRGELAQTDFAHIWWVGDKANGGCVAVKLKNALSTDGFSLKTGKNSKGQTTLNIKGHRSITAQNEVPMEFYSIDGNDAEETSYTYTEVSTPTGNPHALGYYVLVGDRYRLTDDTTVDSNVTYYTRSASV